MAHERQVDDNGVHHVVENTTGSLFNVCCSSDPSATTWFGKKVLEKPKKALDLKVNRSWKYVQQVAPGSSMFSQLTDIEMGMDVVPDMVLNYFIKTTTVNHCKKIRG